MPKFEVGQTVVLFAGGRRSGAEQHEVVKVGRSLVYIKLWGRERGFRMEDGRDSQHTSSTPGAAMYIRTLEQVAEREERINIVGRLKALGVESSGYGDFKYSNETLLKVIAILEED